MPGKPGVATDKRPLKKVCLHPSGSQARVTQGVLKRRQPILSEPKGTIDHRLNVKWTNSFQAKNLVKGEPARHECHSDGFIGCSGRTLSVTDENYSMPVLSNFCRQKFAQLEAKKTTLLGCDITSYYINKLLTKLTKY